MFSEDSNFTLSFIAFLYLNAIFYLSKPKVDSSKIFVMETVLLIQMIFSDYRNGLAFRMLFGIN